MFPKVLGATKSPAFVLCAVCHRLYMRPQTSHCLREELEKQLGQVYGLAEGPIASK
jgi:hypothetical protein